ncbi:MAG: ABC transporter ATP-binding protein [Bdellovibrionales bacterium]|nr:ABC transporter ATP-binding protein [Bdellovibrionales bacterium]
MSLSVQNISKTFQGPDGSSIHVLKSMSFSIREGEIVAIRGESGSGKSTLLSLLGGLDRPDSGSIFLGGVDFAKLSEDDLTRMRGASVGIVFQQFHLIPHFTAQENVSLPLELLGIENPMGVAADWLNRVRMGHRLGSLPGKLSGGECQRVAIARALAIKPKILLADEPSGSLDSKTGSEVLQLMFEVLRENKTTSIIVTHSEELARQCDREVVVVQGRVQ